jgi:hypothetical protein
MSTTQSLKAAQASSGAPVVTMSERTGSDARPDHAAAPPRASASRSGWVSVIAVVVAVIALAVAVWALLARPASPAAASAPTGQQVADAKSRACGAFTTVRTAVALQTHADLGADPVAVQAVAANARVSMAAGHSYLLTHLDAAAELALAIRSFANDLGDIAMNAVAGVGNDDPAQAARLRDGDALSARITDLCK